MNNHSILKSRFYTASLLALLVIAGIFWLPILEFTLLVTAILAVAAWEWARLINLRKIYSQVLFILLILFLFLLLLKSFHLWMLLFAIVWWLFCFCLIVFYPRSQFVWKGHAIISMAMGVFVLVPFGLAIVQLRNIGPGYLLLGLFLVWAADTGAYFAGRRFGKHKLAVEVSPNKTIEGFIGGILLTVFIAFVGCFLLRLPYSQWLVMLPLAILVNMAGVVGDLFESMMKRSANVKDSGQWLPGHGGLLDRIDSLMCALPVFAAGLILFL